MKNAPGCHLMPLARSTYVNQQTLLSKGSGSCCENKSPV